MDFHLPVFSLIRTESTILSIYEKIGAGENPYSRIFYAVVSFLVYSGEYKMEILTRNGSAYFRPMFSF